jgi:SAM-dependent methyltransferase
MTWQPPLPVIATVIGNHHHQTDAAIRLFRSVARFGGAMAGVDRVAYFVGDIGVEPAERLAQLGVALKVLHEATDMCPDAQSIPALLDAEESGFLIVLAPDAVVHGDFAAWIDRAALSARLDLRNLPDELSLRLSASSGAAALSLYDPGIVLVRRDLAADLGARWSVAVQEVRKLLPEREETTGHSIGAGELALSLAIARDAIDTVALPAEFPVVAGAPLEHDAGQDGRTSGGIDGAGESPIDLRASTGHVTPNFDNQSFWNHRYRHDPQRGSGIGSRGAPRALKESLIRRAIEHFCPSSILDVGCGDLASVEQLQVSQYVGIDISDEVVQANTRKRPDWTFLCGDFIQLHDRQSFQSDLVLCFDVLIHQHDFANYEAFVRRLVQSCRSCGLVGAFQAPPRAAYRSEITAYHEPITRTLVRMGATDIKVIASYRDTVVVQFRTVSSEAARTIGFHDGPKNSNDAAFDQHSTSDKQVKIPEKAFPGRIFFDHLPKTAGTAVNAWLVEALGTGCVSPTLPGAYHRDLIRQYGGLYSVISAHVHFQPGEGLDPRYQYMALFREPVDRVLSWVHYLVSNYDDSQKLRALAVRFLETEGQEVPDGLKGMSNFYVDHFCRINGSGEESDDEKIANALAAIQQYDVVGLYQEMPRFVADVARLVGLPRPREIDRVNVTKQRPQVNQISPALRERIVALNQLDLRLYAKVVAWKASIATQESAEIWPTTAPKWKRYEPEHERIARGASPQRVVTEHAGRIAVAVPVASMVSGKGTGVSVEVINLSGQVWGENSLYPVNLSYHWLSGAGEVLIFDGMRTPLPANGIGPGQVFRGAMLVEAPREAGAYTLVLTLVQESVGWFEDKGFEAARVVVEVKAPHG